jgi:hypothetical protein
MFSSRKAASGVKVNARRSPLYNYGVVFDFHELVCLVLLSKIEAAERPN